MKTFVLTKEQVDFAHQHADQIKNSKPHTANWKTENIVVGLLGEMAYGLMKGLPVNTDVWYDRCDGGSDFSDGADVKTTTYMGPSTELKLNKIPANPKATKLVLAVVDYKKDPYKVFLLGEITFENFKAKCKEKKYYDKPFFCVGVADLDIIY